MTLHDLLATAAGLAALTLSGCLESRSGTLADAVVDEDAAGDTSTGDLVAADDARACPSPRLTVAATGETARTPWRVAVTSPNQIVFSGDEWSYSADPVLRRFDVETGVVDAVPGTLEGDVLVDGVDGALLVLRPAGDNGERSLHYIDASRSVELASGDPNELILGHYAEYGWAAHAVAPGVAAWRSCERDAQGRCALARTTGWRNGEVEVLWEQPVDAISASPPRPIVDRAGVLWAEPTGDPEVPESLIRSWSSGAPTTVQQVEGAVSLVARVGGEVVWFAEDGVWRASTGGAVNAITTQTCGNGYTDGEHLVMLCLDDAGGRAGLVDVWSPFAYGTGALWLWDAADGLRQVSSDGAVRTAPRVDDGVVAWITYDEPDAGCYPPATGTVMVAPAAAPTLSVAVGDVGSGCFCCDSIWPDMELSIGAGLLAWNYGLAGESEAPEPFADPRGGYLSWARVQLTCD